MTPSIIWYFLGTAWSYKLEFSGLFSFYDTNNWGKFEENLRRKGVNFHFFWLIWHGTTHMTTPSRHCKGLDRFNTLPFRKPVLRNRVCSHYYALPKLSNNMNNKCFSLACWIGSWNGGTAIWSHLLILNLAQNEPKSWVYRLTRLKGAMNPKGIWRTMHALLISWQVLTSKPEILSSFVKRWNFFGGFSRWWRFIISWMSIVPESSPM